MQIEIGDYTPATRTVAVTFTDGDITHTRNVNACHDDNGNYDPDATATRVDDVARGVAAKIALGVITVPPVEEVAE